MSAKPSCSRDRDESAPLAIQAHHVGAEVDVLAVVVGNADLERRAAAGDEAEERPQGMTSIAPAATRRSDGTTRTA